MRRSGLVSGAGLKGPNNLRPADVLAHGIDNSPLAVDFSVVHPLQPSTNLAEARPRKLARQMENSKVRVRMPAHRRLGRSFCLFAIEATCTWGGKARHLTQLLIQKYALQQQCSKKEPGNVCRTRLRELYFALLFTKRAALLFNQDFYLKFSGHGENKQGKIALSKTVFFPMKTAVFFSTQNALILKMFKLIVKQKERKAALKLCQFLEFSDSPE